MGWGNEWGRRLAPWGLVLCSLFQVEAPSDADHVVYFTRFVEEDDSEGQFEECRIVRRRDDATDTYYVTPFRQDATVVVHRDRWPD
jgi:hypothetical protein